MARRSSRRRATFRRDHNQRVGTGAGRVSLRPGLRKHRPRSTQPGLRRYTGRFGEVSGRPRADRTQDGARRTGSSRGIEDAARDRSRLGVSFLGPRMDGALVSGVWAIFPFSLGALREGPKTPPSGKTGGRMGCKVYKNEASIQQLFAGFLIFFNENCRTLLEDGQNLIMTSSLTALVSAGIGHK